MKMKRYIFQFMLALAACSVQGQTAYKGQLHVSGERFTRQGSLLRVQLRVSYDRDVLNRGEMLNLTPVLKSDTHRQALSSVVVSGRERERYEQRRARAKKRQRLNIPVVKKDGRQGRRYFDYDTTVAYEEWMSSASLHFESEESSWTGRTNLYEDRLISQVTISEGPVGAGTAGTAAGSPSATGSTTPASPAAPAKPTIPAITPAPLSWVPFLPLSTAAPVSEQKVSGTVSLTDSRHIGEMKNRAFCEAVAAAIGQRLEQEGAVVALLDIHGYGTPAGNYRRNEQQSGERAQQLKAYLVEHQTAKAVTVTWTAEDWQRIVELAQADNSLTLRAAALDVMQHVDITQGREEQLRMLAGGQTYSQLEQRVFPQVRRVDYTATLQHPQAGTGDISQLTRFYEIAGTLSRGSSEYNDLIDLAARLHPDHAVAAINAAGVALTKGDVRRAADYLHPWQTDPRAYQNLGVLHLLRGDTAKAEVYLKMAEAQGVKEAVTVLETLKR